MVDVQGANWNVFLGSKSTRDCVKKTESLRRKPKNLLIGLKALLVDHMLNHCVMELGYFGSGSTTGFLEFYEFMYNLLAVSWR